MWSMRCEIGWPISSAAGSGQRALKHQSPIQALQKGRSEKPELFNKRVQKKPGLDSLAASADGLRR
jgi:hypothetical protein